MPLNILFITKTWLSCDDVFIILENLNYSVNIIKCDRKSCRCFMCINVNVFFKLVSKTHTNNCILEYLACNVYSNCSRSIHFIFFYSVPKGSYQSLDPFVRFIYDNDPNKALSKFLLLKNFYLPLLANALAHKSTFSACVSLTTIFIDFSYPI